MSLIMFKTVTIKALLHCLSPPLVNLTNVIHSFLSFSLRQSSRVCLGSSVRDGLIINLASGAVCSTELRSCSYDLS